jgi:predicted nuclease of predicted toxin-antitoxin system
MRLVIDMNLSPRWSAILQSAGFDADHWISLGNPKATDAEIMDYAVATGSIVLTHDLDFGAILAATRGSAPSVIQIRADDVSPEAIGTIVIAALHQSGAELADGCLITVEPARTRLVVLPLRRGDD